MVKVESHKMVVDRDFTASLETAEIRNAHAAKLKKGALLAETSEDPGPPPPERIDFSLLEVIGPYAASIHNYDSDTRTWNAEHASVSIEKTPLSGDSKSAFRCYKIYHSDHTGRVHLCVGKESLMSQKSCHEQVLRQLVIQQCVENLVRIEE